MTAAEWLASDDPRAMLQALQEGLLAAEDGLLVAPPEDLWPSARKLRLFACACARAQLPLDDPESQRGVAMAEAWADCGGDEPANLPRYREQGVTWCLWTDPAEGARAWVENHHSDKPGMAALLREIVGNPFRPVALPWGPCVHCGEPMSSRVRGPHVAGPCPWLTPTVLSLAHAAYDERAVRMVRYGEGGFSERPVEDGTLDPIRLAILADALEEAGCPAEEKVQVEMRDRCLSCDGLCFWDRIGRPEVLRCEPCNRTWVKGEHYLLPRPNPLLAHLRGPGPHVKGCWAVDLILAKDR